MGRNNADFHSYNYEYWRDSEGDHNVYAYHPSQTEEVGALTWTDKKGAITVDVQEDHQRKGVATGMYKFASQKANELGVQRPELMNSSYGPKGFEWAKSVGLPKDFGKR